MLPAARLPTPLTPDAAAGDGRRLLMAVAPAALLGIALGLGKVVRDCSLTCNVGFELAPLGILAVAALTVPFASWALRLEARLGYRKWHAACALAAAGCLLAFRAATWLELEGRRAAEAAGRAADGWVAAMQWTYLAFFVWLGAMVVLLGANAVEHVHRLHAAPERPRRLAAAAVAGAAGALAGAWGAGRLGAYMLGPLGWRYEIARDNLLLLMAAVLALQVPLLPLIERLALPREDGRGERPRLRAALAWIRADPTFRRLAVLALCAGVADTLGKYLFYWLVSVQYQPSNGRTLYFASFHSWLSAATLAMLAFGTPRLVARIGPALALAALPFALAAGTAALLAVTLLAVMYVVRVVEAAVRDALYSPALDHVVAGADEERHQAVRPLLNGLLPRLGEGTGAVAVLGLNFGLGIELRPMLLVYLLVLVAWLAAVARVRSMPTAVTVAGPS
jgi:hypothetical protein